MTDLENKAEKKIPARSKKASNPKNSAQQSPLAAESATATEAAKPTRKRSVNKRTAASTTAAQSTADPVVTSEKPTLAAKEELSKKAPARRSARTQAKDEALPEGQEAPRKSQSRASKATSPADAAVAPVASKPARGRGKKAAPAEGTSQEISMPSPAANLAAPAALSAGHDADKTSPRSTGQTSRRRRVQSQASPEVLASPAAKEPFVPAPEVKSTPAPERTPALLGTEVKPGIIIPRASRSEDEGPVTLLDAVLPDRKYSSYDGDGPRNGRKRSRKKRKGPLERGERGDRPDRSQNPGHYQPSNYGDGTSILSGNTVGRLVASHDLPEDFEDEPQTAFLSSLPKASYAPILGDDAIVPILQAPASTEFIEEFDEGEDAIGNRVGAAGSASSRDAGRKNNNRRDRNKRTSNQEHRGTEQTSAAPPANTLGAAASGAPTSAKGPQEPRQPEAQKALPAAQAPILPVGEEVEGEDEPITGVRRNMYVSVHRDEQVEVAITEEGMLTEYFVEMAHQAKIRGNVYKGVINNIDTNLQAAFVNFGSGKNGFLQIDEVHPEYWQVPFEPTRAHKYPPIQKVLKVGQEVLVQVVKEPNGSKGAFLTTWVSLAGRFLVLTPGQEQIGVSRKVEGTTERNRLKSLLAGIDPGENMGVIIRTASEGAGKTSIQKDLQYLKRLWKDLRKKVGLEKAPALIYQEADLASRAVRDYLTENIAEIWVDDQSTVDSIQEMTTLLYPRRTDMVKLHQDPRQTLWERFNLQKQLEAVTSREVILPSGGRLVFDQTEALMAIDINSGRTQSKSNFEGMVLKTNCEAAEAIARHLRLRDIGGQVVIDFIEMKDRNSCREVERTMRNAMKQDRARHDVGHLSAFGLLELVRQRIGSSAISLSSEPCPHCRGTGVRRNMEWQALQALRTIQHKSRGTSAGGIFVHECDAELAIYLLNSKKDRLLEMENKGGIKIEIRFPNK